MKLTSNNITRTCHENEIYENQLSLNNKHILELGCGKAFVSRLIATEGENRSMVATEVDQIQHNKNLQITDLPNVRFVLAGAEKIPEADNSFDVVFMFKSLHHVPMEQMDSALNEIQRVLKPEGIAYISEPVFAGDFNEVLRLFHDEEIVRKAAFNAIKKAVDNGKFTLKEQLFFNTPRHYADFAEFENRLIKVTHTEHHLTEEKMTQIRDKFSQHLTENGADFLVPIRVDILQAV
jgi:ubiquinone/menaquinone biosynthesis C-methylase UbiE